MRGLIADMFVTLDGYAFGEGAPAYFGPDLERLIDDNVPAPQVLLMGRKTYEMHADLRARGVDADAEIAHTGKRRPGLVSTEVTIVDPVPRQFFFRDPDGNRFLIVQPDRPSPSENSLEAKEPE